LGPLQKRLQFTDYFKLNILAKQADLLNCYVRHNVLTIEFKPENLPPRDKVLSFAGKAPRVPRIDASKGLKITISLDDKKAYQDQFSEALELLQLYINS
jgi:hypothetical protein